MSFRVFRTKRIAHAFAFAGVLVLASLSAHASDGTVTFTGTVTSSTCTINGGAPSFTVALPPVSVSTLSAAGNTAGGTWFRIALTGCTGTPLNSAHAFFEAGSTIDAATGNLINQAATGAATNVQIRLLNGDFSVISLNKADAQQNSKSATVAGGAATLRYYAQYIATAAATAGSVSTTVVYDISYQ